MRRTHLAVLTFVAAAACGDDLPVPPHPATRCVIEQDGDWRSAADGRIDDRKVAVIDREGRVARYDVDRAADGSIDAIIQYAYDADGRWILAETRSLLDGALEKRLTRELDEAARTDRTLTDHDGDGAIDSVVTIVWGDDGVIERASESFGSWGTSTWRTTYTYDLAGLVVQEDVFRDGLHEARYAFEYDERLVEVAHTTDSPVDGVIDSRTTNTFDDAGFLTGWVADGGLDGTIDSRADCQVDHLSRMLLEEIDNGADGTVDMISAFGYDGEGRMTYELDDLDGDHGPAVQVTTYQYDCAR